MLVLIIVFAFFIGLFFLVAAIALGGFIYNGIKQNRDLQKKCLKILIPSASVWFVLVVVNTILIVTFISNNGGEIASLITRFLELFRK
jgi:hypothetical protein